MLCLHSETGLARGVNHNTITIRLPWPDAALWQNARVHWAVKGSATRNARANTAWECKAAGSAFLTFAAAAVSDYRMREVAAHKIKKTSDELVLQLARTPDILASRPSSMSARSSSVV